MDDYYQLSKKIKEFVAQERPKSILEISASKKRYGAIFKSIFNFKSGEQIIDRINLNNNSNLPSDFYNNIYGSYILKNIASLDLYDVIFIADLLENTTIDVARKIIKALLAKTNNSIIAMTPFYPNDLSKDSMVQSNVRRYHPIAFKDFNFSYFLFSTPESKWQFYSFYPYIDYPILDIDKLCISSEHNKNKKLSIAYILPNKDLTGGMKALLEQMRQLTKRGHKVFAYLKSPDGDTVLPEWGDLDPQKDISGQIVVPPDRDFCEYIKDVDIIMAGWMNQLPELTNTNIPVVLWEQGSEAIYGDYGQLLDSKNHTLATLRDIYRLPVCILAVSDIVIEILKNKYGRKAHLLPNSIDTDFYYPSENKKDGNTILLVGNPSLTFKGFSIAIDALQKAYSKGAKFKVKWICQRRPNIVGRLSFPISYIVMPSQEELAKAYREADILLSTSLYESFSLPPFEAMASGVAVIATDNGGIRTYASHGKNILLYEQGDIDSLACAIIYLLNNPDARKYLSIEGRKTILNFNFDKIVLRLEDCLYSILDWRSN
jgi:glycosyltransferase involved in cell wall biosynthesis